MIPDDFLATTYEAGRRDGRAALPANPHDAIVLLCRLAAEAGWDHADLVGRVDFAYLAECTQLAEALDARLDAEDPLYAIA